MDRNRMIRIAALPLLAIVAACGGDAKAEVPQVADAVAVRTAPVAREWVTRPVEATGTLHSKDEIELSFKMPGIVARVLVAEGQQVRRGQTLATLDLREIDAQVMAARSAVTKAERDLARAEALYADSVATLAQVQDARTGAEVARSGLQGAASWGAASAGRCCAWAWPTATPSASSPATRPRCASTPFPATSFRPRCARWRPPPIRARGRTRWRCR
jgi:multidrug efflux pump subunit AcrA (membrane-fusion protein)